MRLARVRYSLAENTPTRFSPGMSMNFGQSRARADEDRVEAVLREEGMQLARAADEEVELVAHAHLGERWDSTATRLFGRRNSGMP
jgi:hypothetical protein